MDATDATGEFVIDVTPPSEFNLVSPETEIWTRTADLTFAWTPSKDEVSGLARYQLILNGNVYQKELSPDETSFVPEALLDGKYTWKVVAFDVAGNSTSTSQEWTFHIDNASPKTTISVGEPSRFVGKILYVQDTTPFTLDTDDGDGSGVLLTEYRIDEGDWIAYSKPFTVSIAGQRLIQYRSKDKAGNLEDVKTLSVYVESPFPWDVNDDGQVDIIDLVLVGRHLGETIEEPISPNPDVNNDGAVDISDLVLIGIHFGESTGTPPAAPVFADTTPVVVKLQARQSGELLNIIIKADTPINLYGFQFDLGYDSSALKVISVKEGDLLRYSSATYWHEPEINAKAGKIFNAAATRVKTEDDVLSKQTVDIPHSGTLATLAFSVKDKRVLLQSKLALSHLKLVDLEGRLIPFVVKAKQQTVEEIIVPKKTNLMQNYPNPFNPETWIPYQLAKDATVNISIYDIQGRLVRKLDLGRKPTGIYITKNRAAYWDGRNTVGEKVASGVYFYSLQAEGFTATRKMLIGK